jgi:hypothetical protein
VQNLLKTNSFCAQSHSRQQHLTSGKEIFKNVIDLFCHCSIITSNGLLLKEKFEEESNDAKHNHG